MNAVTNRSGMGVTSLVSLAFGHVVVWLLRWYFIVVGARPVFDVLVLASRVTL